MVIGECVVTEHKPYSLIVDKLKLGWRFENSDYVPLRLIDFNLSALKRLSVAKQIRSKPYPGATRPPRRYKIMLEGGFYPTLFVETGVACNGSGCFPYVRFEFNLAHVLMVQETQQSLQDTILDLMPGKDYADLLAEGHVLFIEIAIDFNDTKITDLEVFHPRSNPGRRFGEDLERPDTINLKAARKGEPSYCVYDKQKESRNGVRRYRKSLLRVEARLRFNDTPRLRGMRVGDLSSLANPFADLLILDRTRLDHVFRAQRHAGFRRAIRERGLQAALQGRPSRERERRVHMLRNAAVPWWDPKAIWERRERAFRSIVTLRRQG